MLFREFVRTLKKSRNRFFSIFMIVALGVAFFSGIRATEPDMRLSGDAYYDAQKMTDLRVISTLGLTDHDVEEIRKLPGVADAQGDYFKDFLAEIGDSEQNLRVMSYSDTFNVPELVSGRFPEAENECLLDSNVMYMEAYQIGDVVTLQEKDAEDVLGVTEFTIVGFAKHPYFISLARGSSSVGDGTLNGLLLVRPEAFVQEYYTDILVHLDGSKDLVCYGDAFEKLSQAGVDSLEEQEDRLCQDRYDEVVGEATEKLDEAKADLAEGKEKLADAKKEADEELSKAEQELKDAEQELLDAEDEIADGEKQIAKAKRTIASNESKIADTKKELAKGETELADAKKELEAQKETFAEQKAQVEEAQAQIAAAQAQIEEQKQMLEAGKAFMPEEEYQAALMQIEAAEAALQAQAAEVEAAAAQIAAGEAAIASAEEEITAGEAKIASSKAQITKGEKEIASAKHTLSQKEKDLKKAKADVADGWNELEDGKKEYEDAKKEAEEKIADAEDEIAEAEEKIADAEDEIADIEFPEWIIQERDEISQVYGEYDRDASNIGALGRVFPVIFFLVAMLVSLTTMTRMVQEERMQIGTLKALGYSAGAVAGKYIGYGLTACIAGSIVGVLIGEKILPYVIIHTYSILYTSILKVVMPYSLSYSLLAILIACGCILAAIIFSCYREMREVPASLMRPVAPKAGKKLFVERFGFWRNVSFTSKSTIRNLVRYRKRLFMTLFGIAGCMALVIVGFGLLDSISAVSQKQFVTLHTYDAVIGIDTRVSRAKYQKMETFLQEDEMIEDYLLARQETMDIGDEMTFPGMAFVVSEPERLSSYIRLHERGSEVLFDVSNDGVVIAEKTAAKLHVGAGDMLRIHVSDTEVREVKILGVTENYYQNYLFMTPEMYTDLTGKEPQYNSAYLHLNEGDETALAERSIAYDAVVQISFVDEIRDRIDEMLDHLGAVIAVIILAAAMLAFVVIYNLNNINIGERKRELATLKVLGFYNIETASYVFRENVLLTIFGILAGLALGKVLHAYVITTVEVELIMFGREIKAQSYLYSALLTFAFSMIVNALMYFQLKKIDMVESLKNVE